MKMQIKTINRTEARYLFKNGKFQMDFKNRLYGEFEKNILSLIELEKWLNQHDIFLAKDFYRTETEDNITILLGSKNEEIKIFFNIGIIQVNKNNDI